MIGVTEWVNIVFLFIWCDGSDPGSQWNVRVTVALKHSNLLTLLQFWPALQRGRGRSTALRACAVHHAGAHAVVAVVALLCHGHSGHAARSERHPQLWPQQFHTPESHSSARSSHRLRLGLSGQRHRRAWDPGEWSPRPWKTLIYKTELRWNLIALVNNIQASTFPITLRE